MAERQRLTVMVVFGARGLLTFSYGWVGAKFWPNEMVRSTCHRQKPQTTITAEG